MIDVKPADIAKKLGEENIPKPFDVDLPMEVWDEKPLGPSDVKLPKEVVWDEKKLEPFDVELPKEIWHETTPRSEADYLLKQGCLPSDGTWTGDKGDSIWIPDLEKIPDPENKKRGNPETLTWKEILDKYGIKGIPFKDGEPDFSEVSKEDVKIDDFTESRSKNFSQADVELAKKWTDEKVDGKKWTPRDIEKWRKENNYTWHECKDCKTLQLVPAEIHNNVPHAGGISEIKKQQSA